MPSRYACQALLCVAASVLSSLEMAKRNAFSKYLAELGRKGGKARGERLTPEQRRESARKAAQARWKQKQQLG